MRNRLGMVIMLTLFICLGVIAPSSAQGALPLPAVGQTNKVFVSPSVLRAMQGQEKYAPANVRVIVSFETRGGRSGALSVDDVSTARNSILAALPAGSYEVVSSFNRIAAVSLKVNETSLAALRATPGVVAINLDQVVTTYMAEANAVTGVASVHTGGITGDGAVVAIIDTGVDSNGGTVHPALADDLLGQACFRTENDCIGGAGSAEDQDGHGTHVAGMITGPEGVAPDAEFYALKVFTTGDTSDTNILNALDFVIDTNTTTPGAINLINMSLGGDNFSDEASCDANSAAYATAFSTLNAQGVTIFVATGNDAQIDEVGSPGCVTGSVGVGSTGDDTFSIAFQACTDNAEVDKVSCYSNATPVQGLGELVDLVAPGCLIISTGLNGAVDADSCGTSMATPYAAGVAALLIEYLDDNSMSMTPAEIEEHMEATGVQVSDYRMAGGSPSFPRVSPPAMIGSLEVESPTNFEITAVTSTSVSTSWTAAAGATEYRVYASKDSGVPFLAGTVSAPTTVFVDNAPVCGTLTYFVRSYDGSFESLSSNTDTGTSRACPLAPSGLQLSIVDGNTHNLAWTDHNADETNNILQRQVNGGGYADYQTIAGEGTVIQYTDAGLTCGIYEYRAISERNGDLSLPSNIVQRAICAPANDDFANAEVVVAETPYTDTEANQSYATEEVGDPIYSCHFGAAGPGFQGVWYSITPAANTRVTVSTAATTIFAPSAGVPDTLVAIYTGSHGSLTEIACNDDIDGFGDFNSTVSSNLNAGTTYYVFVSQWVDLPVGTTGNLVTDFTWSAFVPAPANDLFSNAEAITTNSYDDSEANMLGATISAGDPDHSCIFNGPATGFNSVWYTFTPAYDGLLDIDTDGSTGDASDTALSIFTGTAGNFTEVDCDDDSGVGLRSMLLDVPLVGGTPYTIYVSLFAEATVASTLILDFDFTPDPGVTITPTTVAVAEGGPTDTYTVVLNAVPSGAVTVTITGDADCSVDSPTLTFTVGNFSTPQTVTVTAVDDSDIEDAHSCTITHSAAGGGYAAVVIDDVTGTITDNDFPPSVTVDPVAVAVAEGGPTDTYTVVLDIVPSADVTVTVTGDANCSVNTPTLTFPSADFSTPQTVIVTAVDDGNIEGNHTCTITHSAAGGGYDAVVIDAVNGTVSDNDFPSVTVTPTTVAVVEGGTTAGYTVVLNTLPTADVTVTVTGDADCSVNSPTLTFTPGNFSTPQTVTVTAVDDAEYEGDHTCIITHSATGGSYDGVAIAAVNGTVTDDEFPAADIELLHNGGFEIAGSPIPRVPEGWSVKSYSGDKRACPVTNKALTGNCAFKFTGNVLDKSKLVQIIDLTGHTFAAGDTLTFSAFFKGNNSTAKIKMALFVTYAGSPTPVRTAMFVRRNVGYIEHSLPAYTLTSGDITQIRVMFNHMSHAGVSWIDDASVILSVPAVVSREDGLLDLPVQK